MNTSNILLREEESLPKLFEYQKDGSNFLLEQRRCILADEMGLGKTVQVLDACNTFQTFPNPTVLRKKIVIVCPKTCVRNWEKEIRKWAIEAIPNISIVEGKPSERVKIIKAFHKDIPVYENQYLIVGYETLRIHSFLFKELDYHIAVLDEAHKLKNRKAKITQACRWFTKKAQYCWLLTGTPVMNNIGELWSLLNLIDSENYRSYWRFVSENAEILHVFNNKGRCLEKIGKAKNPKELKQKLSKHLLRREKEGLLDLPPLIVCDFPLSLQDEQQKLYDKMENQFYCELKTELEVAAVNIVSQITRLRQIAVSPDLLDPELPSIDGAKYDAILELLSDCDLTKDKVVIFSQFASFCTRLADCEKIQVLAGKPALITGQVTGEERQKEIDRFSEDDSCRLAIVSTLAGGQGIPFIAGNICILVDMYWNPAINQQAIARLHRYGQQKTVLCYLLLASGTIEDAIYQMVEDKQKLFEAVVPVENISRYLLEKHELGSSS